MEDYAIFMLDPTGYVVSWNTGAERIKGYNAEEIVGRHFSCFYPQKISNPGNLRWDSNVRPLMGSSKTRDGDYERMARVFGLTS